MFYHHIAISLVGLLFVADVLAESQSKTYLQAKKAVYSGQWDKFQQLKDQLQNHPLKLYLEYYQLNRNFNSKSDQQIIAYLNKYPNTPTASKVKRKWLRLLIERKDWQTFVQYYKPSRNVEMQCYYLTALQQTKQNTKASTVAEKLWLSGRTHPENCAQPLDQWLSNKADKNQLLWQRFELALRKYNFKLANQLAKSMPTSKKNQALTIITLYAKPKLVTKSSFLNKHSNPEVISYGLARLARISPVSAIRLQAELDKRYHFSKKQNQRIFQAVAMKYAMLKHKDSTKWFRKVVGDRLDPVYHEWMIRAALYHGDWELVQKAIESLPPEERQSAQWQYWYARALEKLNQKQQAHAIFGKLAKTRSYHGFLASHHINAKMPFKKDTLEITEQEKHRIANLPAFQRAKMLFEMNQILDAKLELIYLLKHSNVKDQYVIIKLADQWGWDKHVLHLSRFVDYKGDLDLRFPIIYDNHVSNYAKMRNLNRALVYAIIRQESHFVPHAKSHAGAVGLMQLIPSTAHKTSKQFNLSYKGAHELTQSEKNIELGCAHLRKLHQQFKQHPILVIAAYNAGKNAVKRWIPKNKSIPADIWVETIPYYETRNYLKNVIAYHVVYQHRLGREADLDSIMKAIQPVTIK